LTAIEDTEAFNDRARPRASTKMPFALRNLHTFYIPIMEAMVNSDHAEFLFLSSRNQMKEPKIFNET
jgi:hypothetical protein